MHVHGFIYVQPIHLYVYTIGLCSVYVNSASLAIVV